jgi:hypothetical protein
MLQGWRDPSKQDETQWVEKHYAEELCAFRLALPMDVLKIVRSTIVSMLNKEKKGDHMTKYIAYPWV